tara:strand:+ start:239 stop:1129 length:891 start_codon:yes stop_codon:yes gene_type:complete
MYNSFNNFKKQRDNKSYKKVVSLNEKSLEKEEEYELIIKWQNLKDKKSLNRILGAYKKLVVSFSKKYLSYGLSQEDLVQEGTMGLIYAIDRFDINKGFRLSTYAHWWIKAMIQDYILKNWSIVKNGTTASQKTLFFSFNKLKKLINFESINAISIDEIEKISKILNMKPIDVENLQTRLKMGDQSLNQTFIDNDDSVELITLLKDDKPTQDIVFEKSNDNKIKKKYLLEAIDLLNDREKFIIKSRKLNDKPITLDEIGKQLKISKERVRQLEVNSLNKLKKYITTISKENKSFFIN